jgi:anti-sigma B factor antagonist
MTIASEQQEPATVIRLEGRFDAHVTSAFHSRFEQASASNSRVVVDLSAVGFVDTSGLAALVQGMKRCRELEGDLRLAAPRDPVRIILELTRLDRAMRVYPNLEAALASFDPEEAGAAEASLEDDPTAS